MTSALNMAIYASFRAIQAPERLGTSMSDLLGAPNENDSETLRFVEKWFQNAVKAASAPGGLLIHCSDNHLMPIDTVNRKYRDIEKKYTMTAPQTPGIMTDNACGNQIAAFAYAIGLQQVMVLCSDSPKGALMTNTGVILDIWRQAGNLKEQTVVVNKGIDALGMFLSTKILHELMHVAADWDRGISLVPSQFPGILPDKVNGEPVGELYEYTPISGKKRGSKVATSAPNPNNLRHNADSMALLAASWDLPAYGWANGECATIGKARQAPLEYPDMPKPPGPS
ncbi:uncharacterized protein RCO7_02717 [Rhynchosporium graminicola]|uniref:Uncharacterized protein n=1 Tax=Rhynchosporium graminicola TaxID=2792576 RepID=A0A1E1KG79_9HELO|nr:uncharacterized protein RCO7_02717 [Rhynchosporium commune]